MKTKLRIGLLLCQISLFSISSGVIAAPDGWQEFTHSSGAVLSHPPDWQVSEQAGGLVLQPSDSSPGELIIATGVAANGTTDPASADVASYLDASVMQMFPGIRRTGSPEPVAVDAGEGALYRYTGTLFDGTDVESHVYVVIKDDIAFTLSAIGPMGAIEDRSPMLEQVFASIDSGAPAAPAAASGGNASTGDDPRLIGMFAGESIAGGGNNGVYVNTQLVYVLNADGTLYYGAKSHFNASERDYNGNLIWTASGNSDGNVDRGRWSAANGFLTIDWDSGQRSYFAYGFEPDGSLVVRDPQTRRLINFYSRVR